MSHVTIALPWVSLNLRAQRLHHRAILQRSPGINLAWKQLPMNLDCLEKFPRLTASMISRHSWLSDSYLSAKSEERRREREVSSISLSPYGFFNEENLLHHHVKCEVKCNAAV
ncbi:unnamed protein product [Pleuronectes platessa]|uniref:Uncharacterized protein n=1 Tax=Pleuronectes platessa TaxID=8262 RepID=A0A9N7Z4N0_PLEPL|nr:unnamed protein product [Pleuronectes platessa]